MDPIRNGLREQRTELKSQVKQPPDKLTAEDVARLSAKHEEIIMVLRLWHGYSRIAADRALSNWLYHNSLPHSHRTEDSSLRSTRHARLTRSRPRPSFTSVIQVTEDSA